MDYYNEIKNELIDNEVNKRVKDYSKNRYELEKYYNVGKLLMKAGKHYGEGIIKEYSKKLTSELGKGYTPSRLRYFRRFYYIFSKCPTLSDKLSYSHYCELIWNEDYDKINYYINLAISQNLSVRKLRDKIKSKEYERLPVTTKYKLITKEKTTISDFVKNPIVIKNSANYAIVSEKTLLRLILDDIPSFMEELGVGFTFIKNEYKITIGNTYNYIDLLLFNIEYNCYVVVELKVTELKKEHIGQIQVYMNYIDKHIKTIYQDKTIGIIIAKKDHKYVIEYSSDKRIISRSYELL